MTEQSLVVELIGIRTQLVGLKVPPFPRSVQRTDPEGADGLPRLTSRTIAVKFTSPPEPTEALVEIKVNFTARLPSDRVEFFELCWCAGSGTYNPRIVSLPAGASDGIEYCMTQEELPELALTRTQTPPFVKFPPAPKSDIITTPVGAVFNPDPTSVTVTW